MELNLAPEVELIMYAKCLISNNIPVGATLI